ncbi:MAG TPA: hypothetical protein VG269_17500 [Tepidisphaeraceae bacterium]|jgi:hypothetical protein|nr:hypothetical protein [Tepidisphaeraceae bacterium]
MGKGGRILAAVALAGFSVAFSWRYLQTYGRAEQSSGPVSSPVVPAANDPHFRESLVSNMAKEITGAVMRYRSDHGEFPPVDGFWTAIGIAPLHNPLNGSDKVVPMSSDRDADYSAVGWVYSERGGVVFPGVVFNASRPATQP